MKTRTVRLFALAICTLTPLAAYPAASRVCSIFVESYTSLQQQLFQGAEVFESPQLGALPMMLTLSLPGAAHINPQHPVALHLFDTGDGQLGFVLETSPAGTPEAYLQTIQGNTVQPPDPLTGIYTFDGGAARIAGDRVLLSPLAADLEACAGQGAGALPTLPDIPGTIRILLSPGALKPWLEQIKHPSTSLLHFGAPSAAQAQHSLFAFVEFYEEMLVQVAWLQLGISIQKEGLGIDMRLAPNKGSDLEALVASAKPVTTQHLAFLKKDSLFSLALGSYTLPQHLRDQILRLYAQMLPQATVTDEKPVDVAALMSPSLHALGAPLVMTATLTTNAILAQGVFDIDDAAGYLNEQVTMMRTAEFKKLMSHSGMTLAESPTRVYKGATIHPFAPLLDEERFKQSLRDQRLPNTPTEAADSDLKEAVETMRTLSKFFGSGYEYAAVGPSLAFGMGLPTMAEQAIDHISAPTQTAEEAERIQTLLRLPAAPCAIGRLSLSALAHMTLKIANVLPRDAAAALPPGDGICFAKWVANGEEHTRILVPPFELKAIQAAAQAISHAQNDVMPTDEEPVTEEPESAMPAALE